MSLPRRVSESESDELAGLFSHLFSPSQLYTTPIFIFLQVTLSSRSIGTTAPAQCTHTIESRPIFPGASRSHEPHAMFCGRREASTDGEAYHSASSGHSCDPSQGRDPPPPPSRPLPPSFSTLLWVR